MVHASCLRNYDLVLMHCWRHGWPSRRNTTQPFIAV